MSPHYGCCTEYLVGISCTQEQTRSCWRGATISFGTQSKEEAAVGDHQRSNDQSTVCSFLAATEEAEAAGDEVDHHLGSNIQAVAAAVDEGGGLDIQLVHPSSLTFHIPIQGFEASP